MRDVCKWFTGGSGTLPDYLRVIPQLRVVPPALLSVAKAFVDLQDKRHLADYSVATPFVRADALQVVSMTETTFASWKRIRKERATDVFLLLLLIGDGMRPR